MAFRTYSDQVIKEGDNVHTYEANESVSQGQLLKFDTDDSGRTVEPSDTDGEGNLAGFALYDASSGEQVAVAMTGCVVRATSGTGSVSSGDEVASHGGTGEEGEVDTAASGDYTIGTALEDDAGTNDDVIVHVDRGNPVNG